MNTPDNVREAIEVLQELGLKEYEARCFVGLTRLNSGTAKSLSDLTEVPRTRVYDAIRILEAKGLVEIQHSSPQRFRATSLEEATETLRDQYDDRIERLHDSLGAVDNVDEEGEAPIQQVWSMAGRDAIENRTEQLLGKGTEEIILVLGDESLLTENLVETLNGVDDDIELVVGSLTKSLETQVQKEIPGATTFVSGLEWLHGGETTENETAIGRLLLVDRSTILVSSIMPDSGEEQAIFGEGFGNGLVVIARRLMAQGLIPARDPTN